MEKIVLLAVFADIHANRRRSAACLGSRRRRRTAVVASATLPSRRYGADRGMDGQTVMDLVNSGAMAVRDVIPRPHARAMALRAEHGGRRASPWPPRPVLRPHPSAVALLDVGNCG
jgi:hypothetical protein